MASKVKLTLYFPEDLLKEAQDEAKRQDRSISWVVQQAWRLAREQLAQYPSIDELSSPSPLPN